MVRSLHGLLAFSAALSALAGPSIAGAPNTRPAAGWELERNVDAPSYAVTEPSKTDLNIDSVVLLCEQGPQRPVIQLRLYLSGNGPLAPVGAANLKDDPQVEIAIDKGSHPVQLLFADDFVVVADAADGAIPLVSGKLLDALQTGRRMEFRFHYVQEAKGRTQALDATAVVDLQAGPGGAAVAAVRRCTGDSAPQVAQAPGRSR
ncbi:MAG: hypothetical protein U1E60_24410 [Reyranellaceae bacterium]